MLCVYEHRVVESDKCMRPPGQERCWQESMYYFFVAPLIMHMACLKGEALKVLPSEEQRMGPQIGEKKGSVGLYAITNVYHCESGGLSESLYAHRDEEKSGRDCGRAKKAEMHMSKRSGRAFNGGITCATMISSKHCCQMSAVNRGRPK